MKKINFLRKVFLKNSFKNFSKKNIDPAYEYQQQNYKEKSDYVYKDEQDIQREAEAIKNYKINREDFRLSYLNQDIKEEPKIEIDPVFGTEIINPKPFDSININQLFQTPFQSIQKNYQLMDYIPDFTQFEIHDQQLKELLEQLEQELEFQGMDYVYEEDTIVQKYKQENIQKKMMQLSKLIQNCHQIDIANLICFLSFRLNYNEDYVEEAQIYKNIENLIHVNYHVFQTDQLIKIYYGLTFVSPKKCSSLLRLRIKKDLIKLKSAQLNIYQVLKLYFAIRSEFNFIQIHYKCFDYIINQYKQIQKQFAQDPKLPLNIVYTYCICGLKNRYRKRTRIKNEYFVEIDKLNDLFLEKIEQNFQYYNQNDIYKLFKVIVELKVTDYVELYDKIEEYLLKNFDSFSYQDMSYILGLSQSCNNYRGIFSRKGLKNLFGKFNQKKYFQINDIDFQSQILNFLTKQKNLTVKQFQKIYGDKFVDNIRNLGQIECKTLTNLTQSSICLYLLEPKNSLIEKMLNNLLYLFSKQDYWIPKIYSRRLSTFLYLINQIQPTWNTSLAENLVYHGNKKLEDYQMRNKMNLNDYKNLDQIIRNLQTNLISFLPFKNLFVLDYCMEERKLVYFLLKEIDFLYSKENEEEIISPSFDMKVKLLELSDWTVAVIDYREFESLKEQKQEWLKSKLEENYKLTQQKAKQIHLEKRLDIIKHEYEIEKYIYEDQRSKEMKKRKKIVEQEEQEKIKNYLKEQG